MRIKYTFKNGTKIDLRYDDWITTENSHRVLLGENGEILAGFGGKFTGEKISDVRQLYQINKTISRLKQAKYIKDVKVAIATAPNNVTLTCGNITLKKDYSGKIITYVDGKKQAIKGSELKAALTKGFNIKINKINPVEISTQRFKMAMQYNKRMALRHLPVGSIIEMTSGFNKGKWVKQENGSWHSEKGGDVFSTNAMANLYMGDDGKDVGLKVTLGKWQKPPVDKILENKTTIDCKAYDTKSARQDFQLNGNFSDNRIQYVMSKSIGQKLTVKEAEDMYLALRNYTSTGYRDLRTWETTGCFSYNSDQIKMEQMYKNCAKFIDMSPKSQGILYRGTLVSTADIAQWQQGGTFKLDGVSSFTSDRNSATEWASDHSADANYKKCVFVTNDGVHRATPIAHLSYVPSEQENLVHPDATFKLNRVETENGILYVYIDEQYGN